MITDPVPRELSKGANVALRELGTGLGSITLVLETGHFGSGDVAVDADVSVLLLGPDGKVRSNDDMVFYNQRIALDGAIRLRDKIRSEADGESVVLDTVSINLDEVPDEVARLVLVASLDPSLEFSFGEARYLRMRVQRSADGVDLVGYSLTDLSEETALLIGEFYRRDEAWRLRAIGQGYRGGLAQLATDFGVDIESTTDPDPVEPEQPPLEEPAGETHGEEVASSLAAAPVRLSVRRPVRPPKMPAAWNRSIPAADDDDWKPARLFSVAGIRGQEEQEQRATAALLSVAAIVKEFGRSLVTAMGGPSGALEAFTEVRFGQDERIVRPDGVLCSRWGQRTWTALIEVKTAGEINTAQIDNYVEVARSRGYDAVIMISNELTLSADDYPIDIDRRKLRKVALRHLGWDEIRNLANLCLNHRGVADPTQRRILDEFLRYLDHPRSGTHGFIDMGQHWVKVRDGAKDRTLRPSDRGASEVINRFDQLLRHIGLGLSSLLGVDVQACQLVGMDTTARCRQLADSGVLFGSLRVPGAVDAATVGIDLGRERVSCSVQLPAPREGRPGTRVNWLMKQLEDAHDGLRVEALLAGARGQSTAETLKTLRVNPQAILPKDGRDIRAFRLTLDAQLGSKRDAGDRSAIASTEAVVHRFYAEVLQHLQRWTVARPPRLSSDPGA
jgi:stress response protein SCP2